MHIAVSAEARNRANREFRAIATSNPFIPRLASPLQRISTAIVVPLVSISISPWSRWIYIPFPSRPRSPLPSSRLSPPPASALTHPRVLFPLFFSFSFFLFLSFFSLSPHDARRQLRDATNCSHVYRHIIIIRKGKASAIPLSRGI